MKITRIHIERFRWFKNQSFEVGKQLTVIAWLNGTQKTTILWLLSQPFSISDTGSENPMHWEKPLCWWSFKSAFSDKFRISPIYDKAWEHEWTLFFDSEDIPSYTVESIPREKTIRFWKKWDKGKWSWYIQLPVIFLSLKRLIPIGEDSNLKEDGTTVLTQEELDLYARWHNDILVLTREQDRVVSSSVLKSNNKQTLWVSTSYYDWKTNSAWQDNLWKILLAILSFKRLKEKYWDQYKGWILAIDEIDTTLYPWSQLKLINFLTRFSSDYGIQIFFSTHSLSMLEKLSEMASKPERAKDIKLAYFERRDDGININTGANFSYIKNHLNRVITWRTSNKKIDIYTEDKEAQHFIKCLLKGDIKQKLKFVDVALWCSVLIDLWKNKIPSFSFPNSIVALDWDVRTRSDDMRKINRLKNFMPLPTEMSPEQILSKYLHELEDSHPLWKDIDETFDHWTCFIDYSNDDVQDWKSGMKARVVAKNWYNSHIGIWWNNASKVWKHWKRDNASIVSEFNSEMADLVSKFESATW